MKDVEHYLFSADRFVAIDGRIYLASGSRTRGATEVDTQEIYVPVGKSWLKVSAERDGTFTVTNPRNGFSKTYRPLD